MQTSIFKYAPVGRCVYCEAVDDLTDEHVIPHSLGGVLLLPKASCTKCAEETKYIEGYCGRNIFHQFRLIEKIKSRKRNKQPKTLPLRFITGSGITTEEIGVEKYPGTVALPIFSMPGILVGGKPDHKWSQLLTASWTKKDTVFDGPVNATGINIRTEHKASPLSRLIAKIAHCYAIGEFGIGSFTPFLTGIILGKTKNDPFFIGSNPELQSAIAQRGHTLKWEQWDSLAGGPPLLIVTMQFFANLGFDPLLPEKRNGSPIYYAVVGEVDRANPLIPLSTSFSFRNRGTARTR